ncbi:MAG: hydrogenase iron-sulfur subunit [Candidatus Riflebacteria bacterium]|nr:hydrogenase iron-sulfur subunit [Candidatus Riflebacteria bacterium]
MERLGLFLCTGCEIGKAVDTGGFEKLAKKAGATVYAAHPCLCSPEGLATIEKAIADGTVDRFLIAACSPNAKPLEFRYHPTKVAVERASLREQVAWTHKHGDEDTQLLAEDLLRMGLARVSKLHLSKPPSEAIDRTVLVVGGGAAGLNAAKAAADMGHPVVLVEAGERLGGHLATVKTVTPECPPYETPHANRIADLIGSVERNPRIRVLKQAMTKAIDGQPGQFSVTVAGAAGEETFKAGAIVQATGAKPYEAAKLAHLGYGVSPDVVTSGELEVMLSERKVLCPRTKATPRRIVFVQCAGSRDKDHLPYCSADCCATTLRQLAAIHELHPDSECVVVYRDMRTPGQLEHFYKGVQERTGSLFTRGVVKQVQVDGRLEVRVTESLLGDDLTLEADLVVLGVGMVPHSADGEKIRQHLDAKVRSEKGDSEVQRKQAAQLAEELKGYEGTEILHLGYRQGPDLPVLSNGYPDSHYICFPYETRRTGIYAAGCLRAPMDAAQAVEDGWGAALKAVQCIAALTRGEAVHPRAGDVSIADFFMQRCTQCKRCTEECPFGTLNEDEKGTPQYNPLRCRRCGICLGSCPERIISFPEYSVDAVASMVKVIEVPEEDEEKPRMLAFLCENDALPALDELASRRVEWNPWIRIIPVRCLGAVNIVWIADSLSRGIDGVLLLGCKRGDDYQCHYMRGSELANTRMTNVKETLDRLKLESDRVRIVELGRDEFGRIPEIFQEFAGTIERVGPNPYKGL